MKGIRKYSPLLLFATVCMSLAAANWKDRSGAELPSEEATAVCSQTCNQFASCASSQLPPHMSAETFRSGCYSGCMKHAGTVKNCLSRGAITCEEIMECSLKAHFKKQ
ncbi:MAG: Cys-rich protein [Leptospiraceae bacterium]